MSFLIDMKSGGDLYSNSIVSMLGRGVTKDTEDRERLCSYFEELMDIVGLESSGGHLNNFMYGFDPNKN